MKIEITYEEKEYKLILNGKEVFKWPNHRRVLRELKDILNKHSILPEKIK